MQGSAHLLNVGAMAADGLMQLVAGDVELPGPIGDVRRHLGVDLFGIVRPLGGVLLMECVRFVALAGFFFGIAVLGDGISSFRCY